MTLSAEDQKRERIEGVVGRVATRITGERAAEAARFVRQFYGHVPPADLAGREPDDLCGAALSLWNFAATRAQGSAKLRAFNPRSEADGWRAGRTVVEVVNDDMPFLVDSVTAALNGLHLTVHLVIHPIIRVVRDEAGALKELLDVDGGNGGGAGARESVMHVEVTEQLDPERLAEIAKTLERVLSDVRSAVADWRPMRAMLAKVRAAVSAAPPKRFPMPDIAEAGAFLEWLDDDNFTFLGYRQYRFGGPGSPAIGIAPGSGLGILRDDGAVIFDGLRDINNLPPAVQEFLRSPRLVMIVKTNRRASVHRAVQMDAIGVAILAPDGSVAGEHIFVGLFTSLAYSRNPRVIPLLRRKVDRVVQRAGFAPQSHDGKALAHILDGFPRDELFQIEDDQLLETVLGILNLQERQRVALFVRRDAFGRFVSCLVYGPRERYGTEVRERFAAILEAAYGGEVASFATQLDESVLARVHFILRVTPGSPAAVDAAAVERRLAEAARSWEDGLGDALAAAHGEARSQALFRRYERAFPASYKETFAPAEAVADIATIEEVAGAEASQGLTLYRAAGAKPAELRFKTYTKAAPMALSDVLPMLERFGFSVFEAVPYEIHAPGSAVWLQDFYLVAPPGVAVDVVRDRGRFEAAFRRVRRGRMESDGFNRLVLAAALDWRQVTVLRLYAKALRQAGSAFSEAYMADALSAHAGVAAKLVALFERRFDPAAAASAAAETDRLAKEIEQDLDAVTSLDEDRILRGFLTLARHSLRTNYYQRDAAGKPKSYLSVKLASHAIDLLPLPRPLYEIFVYGPRMEGVHLRGGKVARGGIRWSDRREDFRTEILGLMKAQMVKNAVIVPVGSKGGFVVKRPPPASAGRDALMAEVVECYKTLMRGLLDLTDNIVGGKVVAPADTLRHDDDDPYLVVAADKGTATFSDIANGVAAEYGFWLGDAFASGGSAGYDHKVMGITARGAWETVKRHFRELGVDIQSAEFTCVGVGDMSGDVFGNGMLCSEHTKLVAAFDHRHIFLDPDPDPARSHAERKRLFQLPRSSWADYDRSLISKGGAIVERGAKSVALSPEVRARIGIAAERLTPAELIQALLRAEVDLLWFGGIGTFIKSAAESQAEAGDRANDAVRINGSQVRAKVIGEGANLGVTQRGRVEYALKGGRINTDAIDNSAGVDTSDHEVNLKIMLNAAVDAGELSMAERNRTLQEATDDVAALVLRDNYLQGLALTLAAARSAERLDAEARLMRSLEKAGKLDRGVEFLPGDEAIAERAAQHQGLTRPEHAVIMAYVKNTLAHELTATDLPDDPHLAGELAAYFPKAWANRFRAQIAGHRLRREIIATMAANELVNRCGISFVAEMGERTGRGPGDVARAYAIVRGIYGLDRLAEDVFALDNRAPAEVQTEILLQAAALAERATAWFLQGAAALDIAQATAAYGPGVAKLAGELPAILPDSQRAELERRVAALKAQRVPAALAEAAARLDFLHSAVDIVQLALGTKYDIAGLGRRFFAVGARFRLDLLRQATRKLEADTAWRKLAICALIEDFYGHQAALTRRAIAATGTEFEGWVGQHAGGLTQLDALAQEVAKAPAPDVAVLTVANRQFRALLGS